jgi:hypothetical protein
VRSFENNSYCLDHLRWFKDGRKPMAIVSMPYTPASSLEQAATFIGRYGLIVQTPPLERAGWYGPSSLDGTWCFAFVRPGTIVRWLPEQCDAAKLATWVEEHRLYWERKREQRAAARQAAQQGR